MTIDPRVGMWLSIATAVLLFVAGATTELTTIFNAAVAAKVTAGAVFFGGLMSAVSAVLHAIPSQSGPVAANQFPLGPVPAPVPNVATKAIAFIAILVAATFLSLPAFAQSPRERPKPEAKGDIFHPVSDIQGDVTNFLTNLADIDGAVTLSTEIPGLQDPVGNACWLQFSPITALIKAHPLPLTLKIASDIEAARLAMIAMNQVCANPNCGQMFVDATNAASAIAGNPLNISLQSLCSKVPVIGTNAVPTSAAKAAPIGTVTPAAPAPAPK